ncbi:uncharacterized protein LAJ45_08529 [Morchella importuna]|uniref:uncharacterized protein n=1 Tax=Morchella importuna TaxID=1174673 RepID=UPI001E8E88A6|nr:uncharacterized protein LAJ45_08529 [Morchella importuna]KAH8147373.1 hypothetical protein LAJ45_08529 [Morchella importuna]
MPSESLHKPVVIPDKDIFSFLFERESKAYPDNHVIYIDGNTKRELTYADTRQQAITFGIGLKSQWGWRKGDVLAVFSTNNIDTPPLIWGTMWASGTITPANPTYTVEELAFQLKASGAKAIATLVDFLPIATKAAAEAGIPKDRIILVGDKKSSEFKHWKDLIDPSTSVKWRRTKINPSKDVAFLVYSSGTTGLPKGVMLSHTNLICNVLQVEAGESGNLTPQNDRLIAFLPFFHVYGLTCIMHVSFWVGLPTVVMDRFDLTKFCALVQEYRITYSYVVPPVVLLLAKNPIVDNYDLSSLRMVNSGAAPLTKELVEAFYTRLKIPVGTLLPNMTAKYVAEDGTELAPGQTGELWMKGPNIMLGYHNNPAATANAITPDGYFKTGDIGHQDEDGNFWITDRIKELIKYKGFQVAPAELEGLLLGHEKVADCAVTGVHIEAIATEVPRAYVVLAPGAAATEEELLGFIDEKVANHKKLRGGIRFISEIPKSVSGKILRRVLKEQAAQEEAKKNAEVRAKL